MEGKIMNYLSKLTIILMTFIMAACANKQIENERQILTIEGSKFQNCLSIAARGSKSDCVMTLYNTWTRVSDANVAKNFMLNQLTNMYGIYLSYDKGRIDEKDVDYLIMKATNEVNNEIEIVKKQQQIINSQNGANLIRQGGALLNPQSNTITCYHAPGTPFATCSNQ